MAIQPITEHDGWIPGRVVPLHARGISAARIEEMVARHPYGPTPERAPFKDYSPLYEKPASREPLARGVNPVIRKINREQWQAVLKARWERNRIIAIGVLAGILGTPLAFLVAWGLR